MNPKVSVIVPVYNTEKYLHRCIDSILAQTFTDLELLLIDDGSTDNSATIWDEYAAKDSRVRVFHKENGGVSAARNVGLDNAKGKWITFVDADDWIEDNAFEYFKNTHAEDVIVNPYFESYEGKIYVKDCASLSITSSLQKEAFLKRYLHTGLLTTVCSKIYKRDIIGDIRFDKNIIVGEDTLFFLNIIDRTNRISTLPYSYYNYRMFRPIGKYRLSIKESIYSMQMLWMSYEKLNIRNPLFEKALFCNHKSYCQLEIEQNPYEWYNNKFVKNIYSKVKKQLTIEYRIKYHLMKYHVLRELFTNIIRRQ